jgi:branched-chain amino acid transport system substrate-binding protein
MRISIGAVTRTTLSLLVLSSAVVLTTPGSSQDGGDGGVSSSEILVGGIGALTGPFAFIGAPGRDGLALGFSEINQRNVCGRKFRMIFEHASTPAENLAAAKKLVEQDKVFVLVLAGGSTGAAAAADYVRQVGVPTYNLFGSTPLIREPFAKNVLHGAIVKVENSSQALVGQVFDGGFRSKKLGVLAGSYAYPQALLKAVEQVLKAQKQDYIVEQFDQTARDFAAQLVSFSRQGVDAILIIGSFSEAGFAIKQGREIGLANARWVVDSTATNTAIIPLLGNAEGLLGYYNAPYFPGQKVASIQEFESRLKNSLGSMPQGRPNQYDMIGYGSAYVIAEAIQATGCQITREHLIEAWSNLKDAGPVKLGGLDVIFPESFTPADHQGNKRLGGTIVRNGAWEVYRVIEGP